jgi:Radical SAM superfamily
MFNWPAIVRQFGKPPARIKPLGSTSPIVWVVEPYFGCNLRCGHCCAGLIPKADEGPMTAEVWRATWALINAVSPTVRVDICGVVGEPTLHPQLTEWLQEARRLAPLVQIQITTNGTKLLSGKVQYKALLDAGANIIYTDQYGKPERFQALAAESGYPFYSYYDKPPDAPTPWKYHGPRAKFIVLMDQPEDWPESRFRAGLLGNWYGNLDWKEGERFGMKPLEKPLTRRCNQPFLYANVGASGGYLLCCQDGMHRTDGRFGTVLDGRDGFMRFWYGHEMQLVRRRLRLKNRADTDYACAKCNITFSRCDFKHWKDQQVEIWWNGTAWVPMEADPHVGRFNAPQPLQPSEGGELSCR